MGMGIELLTWCLPLFEEKKLRREKRLTGTTEGESRNSHSGVDGGPAGASGQDAPFELMLLLLLRILRAPGRRTAREIARQRWDRLRGTPDAEMPCGQRHRKLGSTGCPASARSGQVHSMPADMYIHTALYAQGRPVKRRREWRKDAMRSAMHGLFSRRPPCSTPRV